ncbi:hypothetical protein [Saccharopolyspora shandongensis]|uniref:hypothetical protein n=1 Tax=Saccharopolyspora shandongensis TaxID=418495 RepID=UPI0033EC1F5B
MVQENDHSVTVDPEITDPAEPAGRPARNDHSVDRFRWSRTKTIKAEPPHAARHTTRRPPRRVHKGHRAAPAPELRDHPTDKIIGPESGLRHTKRETAPQPSRSLRAVPLDRGICFTVPHDAW